MLVGRLVITRYLKRYNLTVMVSSTISHYKVLSEVGRGGMGVVYKAEDTKLERAVALKFLASHLLEDEEARKRFHREAKAAAGLSHPNICTVYEISGGVAGPSSPWNSSRATASPTRLSAGRSPAGVSADYSIGK